MYTDKPGSLREEPGPMTASDYLLGLPEHEHAIVLLVNNHVAHPSAVED
jgi:hypothetical protein